MSHFRLKFFLFNIVNTNSEFISSRAVQLPIVSKFSDWVLVSFLGIENY